MITNERQYAIAQVELQLFEKAAAEQQEKPSTRESIGLVLEDQADEGGSEVATLKR